MMRRAGAHPRRLACLWLLCLGAVGWMWATASVQADVPSAFGPPRVALRAFASDVQQLGLDVPADTLVRCYETYARTWLAETLMLEAAQEGTERGKRPAETLPSARTESLDAQTRRETLALGVSLANRLVDDLVAAVPGLEDAKVQALRGECEIALMMQSRVVPGLGYRALDWDQSTELADLLRGAVPWMRMSGEDRLAFSRARAATVPARRDAARVYLAAMDARRLQFARELDRLGWGGRVLREILEAPQSEEDEFADRDGGKLIRGLLEGFDVPRAEFLRSRLVAWNSMRPALADSAVRQHVRTISRDCLPHQPVSKVGDHVLPWGSLWDESPEPDERMIRVALAAPGLTEAQRNSVREIGREWLKREMELLESLCDSPPADEEDERLVTLARLGVEACERMSEATRCAWVAPWLPGKRWLEGKGEEPDHTARVALPDPEDMQLQPEDDAEFRGAALDVNDDRWKRRHFHSDVTELPRLRLHIHGKHDMLAAANAAELTEAQLMVWRQLWADFTAAWGAEIPPLMAVFDEKVDQCRAVELRSLAYEEVDPEELEKAKHAAWTEALQARDSLAAAIKSNWDRLSGSAKVAFPPQPAGILALWIESRKCLSIRRHSDREEPSFNLLAAACSERLSVEGRAVCAEQLLPAAAALGEAIALASNIIEILNWESDPLYLLASVLEESRFDAPDTSPLANGACEVIRDAWQRMSARLSEEDRVQVVLEMRTLRDYLYTSEVTSLLAEGSEDARVLEFRRAVIAEQRVLDALNDRIWRMMQMGPEWGECSRDYFWERCRTCSTYTIGALGCLAEDLRQCALWRLRAKAPPELVARLPAFRESTQELLASLPVAAGTP